MTDKKLARLIDLGSVFKKSAEAYYKNNPDLQLKLIPTLRPGELAEMTDKLHAVASQALSLILSGGEPDDTFLRENIAVIELNAELMQRIVPVEKLALLIPPDLQNDEDAAAFREERAPTMAALCEFKPA